MSRSLPPVNWLYAFEVTARHMSFTEAAAELGVTQSAVSQRIRLLESHLGQALFHRLPRGLKLTASGEALVPLVRETFSRLSDGTAEIFGSSSVDRLVVQVTLGFAGLWLNPRLAHFRAAHPDVNLRLITSVWSVDYPAAGVDLEIRHGGGNWPGLKAERLTWDKVFPVCGPALLRQRRKLRKPEELTAQDLLHVIGFREGWAQWFAAAGIPAPADIGAGVEFDTAILAIEQALSGTGFALGRSCYVDHLLADGRLVAPYSSFIETREAFYIVAPEGRQEKAAAKLFRTWIKSEAQQARRASI
ncbi:LysR substrate-binding domain-containing protein [Dongia soli]|uniref:LysR substrate-binding domain-containing protein n=1 Tax=Dongia soli TaxID=600628 RepID=A0ABU5EDW6_9PROT|nr:LysR substrate-binding domain-containing protein [Dongia soli]MDY0883730.1 LysR substrate-binding domain-containing protein [Dongia soli]